MLIAQSAPAQATTDTVTGCGPSYKVVNNSHGRFEIVACVRHILGAYESYGRYHCYETGTYTDQRCNIGIDHQQLWYSFTQQLELVDDIAISRLGLDTGESHWAIPGNPERCTSASMFTQIYGIRVRFSDGTLWSSNDVPASLFVQGSLSC